MSFDVSRADDRHIWHPYTQHGTERAIAVASARGAYLHLADGRDIFDAISSWWVTLHGHAHPVIAAAIAAQAQALEQVIFAGFTHAPAARLAHALAGVAPRGLERVFFSDDGSTAVEAAVKMALQYSRNIGERRTVVATLDHAYHGDTFGAMSVSARGLFTAAFDPLLFDVASLGDPADDAVVARFDGLIATRGSEIAAVIVEPMLQGAGGMRLWPAETLAAIRAAATRAGILLIADEVLTGFGRTGPMFACEHAGIAPDILCLSKGLTGGFLPLGVTMATEQIFQSFVADDRARAFFHGHSYTANPLACAAAGASLELLDDACARRRAGIERAHRAALDHFARHPRVANPRVLGTMMAIDIDGDAGYLGAVAPRLRAFALERGVLLRPLGNTVYLLPPYCATVSDLGRAYMVIDDFLRAA